MRTLSLVAATAAIVLFSGCAHNNATAVKPHVPTQTKKVVEAKKRPAPAPKKEQVKKIGTQYAAKFKKEVLIEKAPAGDKPPLYRPPLFAKMIVMPYVSDEGIYHDMQQVWIKIEEGTFVLDQKPKVSNMRLFTKEKGLVK